jgi:transketolase
MRVLPGMTVFSPCDAIEAKKVTLEAAKINGPVYIRLTRDKTPTITTEQTPFYRNKIETFWISDKPQVTIFATGYLLYYALLAAKNLEEQKIQVLVANVSAIKPADEQTVTELAEKSGKVVTVEDHQVAGGMGSMISEVLARTKPTPVEFVGLRDTFGESGQPLELIRKYNLDDVAIENAVRKILAK